MLDFKSGPFSIKEAWVKKKKKKAWILTQGHTDSLGAQIHHLLGLMAFRIKWLFLAPTTLFCGKQYQLGLGSSTIWMATASGPQWGGSFLCEEEVLVIVCLLCQGLLSEYKSSSGRRLHCPHLFPLPALLAPRGSRGCRGHGRGGTEGGGPCTPFSAVCPAKVGPNWRKREDLTESLTEKI